MKLQKSTTLIPSKGPLARGRCGSKASGPAEFAATGSAVLPVPSSLVLFILLSYPFGRLVVQVPKCLIIGAGSHESQVRDQLAEAYIRSGRETPSKMRLPTPAEMLRPAALNAFCGTVNHRFRRSFVPFLPSLQNTKKWQREPSAATQTYFVASQTRESWACHPKGNKASRGNAFARRTARLRSIAVDAVTEDDVRAVMRKLAEQAKAGDAAAAKLVLALRDWPADRSR